MILIKVDKGKWKYLYGELLQFNIYTNCSNSVN